MLRIRMLSGQEVASIPAGELLNARAVKRQLNRLLGMPPRFRQRLLSGGHVVDDFANLASAIDLELLVLTYATASQTQANELVAAVAIGSTSKACLAIPQTNTDSRL